MNKFHFCKLLLFVLIIVFFSSANLLSQCTITDLVVANSECDANDKFSVEIDFNFDETGADGFQILGNGNNYGTFQYSDLPIIIEGLTGNCEIEYEFIVRDAIDPVCAAFYELGTICCDDICEIFIFDFETSDCIDNVSFGVALNLEYAFVGDNGYSVSINGESFGNYSYEELPLNIDDIVSEEEGVNIITVCDNDSPECCDTYTFLNPCVCGMTNITSNIVDCNSDDTTYYVIIDFDHVAANDSFQMGYSNDGTNIFLGTFAYNDLPITAGPIFLSENEQEILIVDTDDFFCFNSAYLGIVDDCNIECQLFNVFGEAYMCEEGEYFMDVDFMAEDIEGSTFDILVDGIIYGTFEYGENVYTIGPIPSNCETAPLLIVRDSEVESCMDFYNFPEPICCLPDCNFTFFEATAECGSTALTVNGTFENNGVMLSGFYFVEFLGTSFGPFPYGDFAFSIEIPLLTDGEYEITINDSIDPECQISTFFTVQCEEEPCIIFNVSAEPSECEENQFFVDIEFEYGGEVSDSFVISGNGENYGTFAYGDQFYTVGTLEGDCETIYEFVISDQILEGCNSFFVFEEAVCCTSECIISEIDILEYVCVDDSSISTIVLDLSYENVSSDMFTFIVDGEDLGSYFYSELPIQFDMVLPLSFVIEIQDSENGNCQSMEEFELDCSDLECTISDIDVEFVECDDNNFFYANLNFNHINTSDSFLITIGSFMDTVNYSDLPFLIGPLSTGLAHIMTIIDFSGNCAADDIIFIEDCETSLDETLFTDLNILQYNNSINIENNEAEALIFQLINTTGALVRSIKIGSNLSNSFDTSRIPHGLYFLNIFNGNSQKTIKVTVY